ncbi:MAG: nucleotide sugar dehydrogenase [Actinobacteria bacterium]|nr:nucleotide sugar dehydrogenase [Actinomycetota bacterium]
MTASSGRVDLVVIGLGYVGLPLVCEAIKSGLSVQGLDISQTVVDQLNAGQSHVDDISNEELSQALSRGFQATTNDSILENADAVIICVPTPLSVDGGPDLTSVEQAAEKVAKHVHADQLVVLESTTWPGTTEEVVVPILEKASGLSAGNDFFVAFSPERIDPGNSKWNVKNTPKIVGGVNERSTIAAGALYGKFIDTIVIAKGTREAETAKLLENTYRHVNIALVNEMAKFCHDLGIDLWDVIRLAATKPFGFQAFYPGPGVGGHCIPIDPSYLGYRVKASLGYPFRFVELAQEINASMPNYVVGRIQDLLNASGKPLKGAKVLLLGVTYKPDIADQRESPAVPIAIGLDQLGAEVSFHDPLVEKWLVEGETRARVHDVANAVKSADIVVLLQNHSTYLADDLAAHSQAFLDTRGVTTSDDSQRL